MNLDLIALKIICLLHDPPFKPILYSASTAKECSDIVDNIVNSREGYPSIREAFGTNIYSIIEAAKTHEKLSIYIIAGIICKLRQSSNPNKKDLAEKIRNIVLNKFKTEVRRYDRASSSIDR